jgi:hypothetical protein
MEVLLKRGDIVVNWKDYEERTPLICATDVLPDDSVNDPEQVVRLLLEHECIDANSKYNYGRTSLSYVANYRYEEAIKLLLEHGDVDANSCDDDGHSPLLWATSGYYAEFWN